MCELAVENHPSEISFDSIVSSVSKKYGIFASIDDVGKAAERLRKEGFVELRGTSIVIATGKAIAEVKILIQKSKDLEDKVRSEWFSSFDSEAKIDRSLYWDALTTFLEAVLKSFGNDALGLLGAKDSNIELGTLQESLYAAAAKYALEHEIDDLRIQVSLFFSNISSFPARQRFIGELAQGLFAWQAIHAPPEVSERLAKKSKPITILVDTSFLIDFIGLADEIAVDNAKHVYDCADQANIEVKWRCLPATENELQRVLSAAKYALKNNYSNVSGIVAGALTKSGSLQGVKAAYLAKRAQSPISVDDFFLKYSNIRKILNQRGIEIYQSSNPPDYAQREEIAELFAKFLEEKKEKDRQPRQGDAPDRDQNRAAIDHDAELLAQAAKIRDQTGSLLEARMLVLSNDKKLGKFDLRYARRIGRQGVVLLPYTLLQMVRPFISSSSYSEALVTNLLAAEFRGLVANGGGEEVKKKVVSLMSGIEGIDVEDAVELLADKAFVRDLNEAENAETALEIIRETAFTKNIELKSELGSVKAAFEATSEKLGDLQERLDRSERERLHSQGRVRDLALEITDSQSSADDQVIQKSAQNRELEDKIKALEESIGGTRKITRFFGAMLSICIGVLAFYFIVPLVPSSHQNFSKLMIVAISASGVLAAISPKIRWGGIVIIAIPLLIEYLKKFM